LEALTFSRVSRGFFSELSILHQCFEKVFTSRRYKEADIKKDADAASSKDLYSRILE
jgi:hypothetical protein